MLGTEAFQELLAVPPPSFPVRALDIESPCVWHCQEQICADTAKEQSCVAGILGAAFPVPLTQCLGSSSGTNVSLKVLFWHIF